MAALPPWRKILYEKQPYEDNYVDEGFLASIITNSGQIEFEFWALVKDTLAYTQQISSVALFCIVFAHSYQGTMPVNILFALEVLLLLIGYLLRACCPEVRATLFTYHTIKSEVRRVLLFLGVLAGLSPILGTLTRSFSDDTIVALTIIFFLVHLVLHDYAYANHYTTKFTGTVSLNASIFASVLLAARLPSKVHVFALMTLAVEVFALMPFLRHELRANNQLPLLLKLTAVLVLVAVCLLFFQSKFVVSLYIGAILTISFLCPMWLIRSMKYKTDITGPWDFAVRAYVKQMAMKGGGMDN